MTLHAFVNARNVADACATADAEKRSAGRRSYKAEAEIRYGTDVCKIGAPEESFVCKSSQGGMESKESCCLDLASNVAWKGVSVCNGVDVGHDAGHKILDFSAQDVVMESVSASDKASCEAGPRPDVLSRMSEFLVDTIDSTMKRKEGEGSEGLTKQHFETNLNSENSAQEVMRTEIGRPVPVDDHLQWRCVDGTWVECVQNNSSHRRAFSSLQDSELMAPKLTNADAASQDFDNFAATRCCGRLFLRRRDMFRHWEEQHESGVVVSEVGYRFADFMLCLLRSLSIFLLVGARVRARPFFIV